MSSSVKSVKSIKSFCKVCFDAGKSESEYSSHFVRNERGGKVVCPTLLNLNCTYCHKKGHTKSYCKDLKKDQKRSEKSFKRFEFETKESKEKEIKKVEKKNVFAALDSDEESDEESDKEEDYPEEFPALSANVTIRENQKKVSFADMAKKPAVIPVVAPVVAAVVAEEVEVPTEPRQARAPMRSWAEWSDSEDEEEFEANGYPERKGYQGYEDETDW